MCQIKSEGGRCAGYFKSQFNKSSDRLTKLNTTLQEMSEKRYALLTVVENAKQTKRDIRARAKEEGRSLNEEEKQQIADLLAEERATDFERKAFDAGLREHKWRTVKEAARQFKYAVAHDEAAGIVTVHEWEEPTLGTATRTGTFEADSDEWHAQRQRGIGGSDVAIIVGTSPFTKRDKLFAIKAGEVPFSKASSSAMALGNEYEPIIQRRFADEHGDYRVWNTKGSWVSDSNDYQLANVDGLYSSTGGDTPDGILEIKAVSNPDDWDGKPPIYYRQQTLWYMDTFGFKQGKIAALVNGYDYREYDIVPEPGEIENLKAEVEKFRGEFDEYMAAKKNEQALAA